MGIGCRLCFLLVDSLTGMPACVKLGDRACSLVVHRVVQQHTAAHEKSWSKRAMHDAFKCVRVISMMYTGGGRSGWSGVLACRARPTWWCRACSPSPIARALPRSRQPSRHAASANMRAHPAQQRALHNTHTPEHQPWQAATLLSLLSVKCLHWLHALSLHRGCMCEC